MNHKMSQNKHNITIFLLALLILTHSSLLAAPQLLPAQDQGDKISNTRLLKDPIDHDNGLFKLTSSKAYCDERDDEEDCQMRRMTAEAHLDYIYTQHHKDSTTTP